MLFLGIFIVLILLIIIALFAFPSLSPIPYFPSNKKDFNKIIAALNLKNKQKIIDLGAGDGVVIFEAAQEAYEKKLDTQFVAVEINPVLLLIMHVRRFFHKNKKNILILKHDLFTFKTKNDSQEIVFYLYVSPWFLEKIFKHLKSTVK